MQYKLVAVDMDGTLLNSDGIITRKTQDAIKSLVDKGIIFTISTGRPIQGIDRYNEELKLDVPFITYNGAMIVSSVSKEVLFEQGLGEEDARNILKLGKKYGTTVIVWSRNKLYANMLNDRVHDYKLLSKVEPILIEDEEALIKDGITKILWYDDVIKINEFEKILIDQVDESVSFCTSKPTFLEFFDHRVSKAIALEKVGKYYNVKQEEMIAIGDGFNDLSMLEYAGVGVAMANATQAVKDKCNYVTLSNNEDGIVSVIENFFE